MNKPKSRFGWLTFSIRTLLIAVTVFCVWLGWEMSVVRERTTLIDTLVKADCNIMFPVDETSPSPLRRLLGDQDVSLIEFSSAVSDAEKALAQKVFPEAKIIDHAKGDRGGII